MVKDDIEKIKTLEKRLHRLSAEKSRLNLLDELLKSFRNISRLEEVIDKILENVLLLHGGMKVSLVYKLENIWYEKELQGEIRRIDISEKPGYISILANKQYLETVGPGDDATIRITHNAHKARHKIDSLYPIINDKNEVTAIISIDGRFLSDAPSTDEIQAFLYYCGILLNNAILSELNLNRIKDEFSQMFNSNIDGIIQTDRDLMILRANRRSRQLLDFKYGVLTGKNISEIESAEDIIGYLQFLQQNNRNSGETTITLKNAETDEIQYCILSITPLMNCDNKPEGYIFNLKDINELKETENRLRLSEERLSIAMRGSNDGLWDWNIRTGETYYSARWKSILGYEDDDFANDYSIWKNLTEPEGLAEAERKMQEIIQGSSELYEVEFRMKHKKGHWVDILSRGFLIRDENGEPVRLIGTHLDLSEIKHKENELRKSKEKAEESERLKTNFLANMSHEVRTPMNGIIGFSRLLADSDINAEQRKQYSGIVIESCDRLLKIVDDILDISQLESGNMGIVPSEVELNSFCENLYSFFLNEAEKKGLVLQLEKGSEESVKVIFDSNRIFQVFSNLISNAVKFTQNGHIRFGYRFTEKNRIEYFVADSGSGIPESYQERIFERFYQHDTSMTRTVGGNGLGLSICKKLVELHGGKLKVKSEKGAGSEFYFVLS